MSRVRQLLESLGMEIKIAGSQIQVDCPECDDSKKHLYIRPDTGVGFCQKCGWAPNPYKLIEKMTSKIPAEIMKMLEEFRLVENSSQLPAASGERPAPSEEKKIALSRDDIRQLTEQEMQEFCRIKRIEPEAFEKFRPFAHAIKPWVLLPAFSPSDSKTACGWLRCALDGKPIPMGGGNSVKYPIIKGSRHGLFGLEWLVDENPDTIIFCEAWRDALSAISIGLHATASSGGASTFNDEWLEVFDGRKVYICMDADMAGQKATLRSAKRIATVAADVFVVTLPYEVTDSNGKDLHDYIVADGYGKDFLLLLSKAEKFEPEQTKKNVEVCLGGTVLENDYPDTIAAAFVEASEMKYRYSSIDGWSVFAGGKYTRIEDENEVAVQVRRFLAGCYILKEKGDEIYQVRIRPSNSRVKDILSSLAALKGVHIPIEKHAPSSLSGRLDPDNIIALNNCMLDISGNKAVRMELSEDFYTFNYLPFNYDPSAKCPRWLVFLGEIFTIKESSAEWDEDSSNFVGVYKRQADELAAQILQEWFGYFVTPGTYLQKVFGLIGPRRSGKSTIGKILRALVGARNTASPTLCSLSTEFGLQPLLNKSIAIVGDANISGKASEVTRAVERLKSISGEDSQQINRKNKTHLEVDKLGIRFVIIANEMQDLRDSSGALASRFHFLVTNESFLGKEDFDLEKNLLAELPGIFNWALGGLMRLKQRGRLLEHPASVESREDFEAMSSPMTSFVQEWCEVGPGLEVPIDAIWKAHCDWSSNNGRGEGFSKQKFTNKLKSIVPDIKKDRKRADMSILHLDYDMDRTSTDNRVNYYLGIDLKNEYKKRMDSRDSMDRTWTD